MNIISRNCNARINKLVVIFSLLFVVFGCNTAKRAARTPETEALLRAASAGNADTVRTLLASPSVDVNGSDDQGNTALILAARLGHDEVVRSLLTARANVNQTNNEGKTALMLAAAAGHDQTVAALMQAGAAR